MAAFPLSELTRGQSYSASSRLRRQVNDAHVTNRAGSDASPRVSRGSSLLGNMTANFEGGVEQRRFRGVSNGKPNGKFEHEP